MNRRCFSLAVLAVALIPIAAFTFGGWAVVTLEDLPDHAVAGQPVQLTYMVRQHGISKLSGLHGSIEAKQVGGKGTIRSSSQPKWAEGQYVGTVTFPSAGDWVVTIRSGFGASDLTLMPINVVAPNAAAPRAISDAERGKRLFVAKGCVTCHVHDQVAGSGVVKVGPELSGRRFPVEYLASFLNDPSIKPPLANGTRMPKLELAPREIASLSAFINADKQVSAK